jgi:CYTH domain-containing protein/predicted ATPase
MCALFIFIFKKGKYDSINLNFFHKHIPNTRTKMNAQQLSLLINIFRFTPWIKVIAITGAPCGGKSTLLKMAIRLLEKSGLKVIIVPEVARELISSGICPWDPQWIHSTSFQKQVLFNILEKEASFFRALSDMRLHEGQQVVFLCDRGIPDGEAYCGKEEFTSLLASLGTTRHDIIERYDGAIHLVTAAIGAEEFYVNDDERHETLAQARQLDYAIRSAWQDHQHFSIIDNSTTFDQKIVRALLALNRIIPMPSAQEIEKKFLFTGEVKIPTGIQPAHLVQHYLNRPDRQGIECRVRKKTVEGVSVYTYTEKTKTEQEGVRGEQEEKITEKRYQELLSSYNFSPPRIIVKKRYKVELNGGLILELDEYEGVHQSLYVGEVEFKSTQEMNSFKMPDTFGPFRDITSDERYSNASLAGLGLPE